MPTPELDAQIAIWRQKALDDTMTPAEYKLAIDALREGRMSAARASDAARRKKARAVVPEADDLLAELGGE